MGRERVGARQYILCVTAILTCFALIGCVSSAKRVDRESGPVDMYVEPLHPALDQGKPKKEKQRDESKEHLTQAQRMLAAGNYDGSIRENLQVLSIAPSGPPGDEAVFTVGLIYASPKYQRKDHGKAVANLTRILKEYPQSKWTGHAKVLLDIIQENDRLRRISAEANQENEKLKSVIEQSKKVDLEVEEKKRERAR